jgi:hypothetical protein
MLRVFEESGFNIARRMHEGFIEITFDLEHQEEFSKRQEVRDHIAGSVGIRRMLYPRTVAVIGASRDADSVGGKVFRNSSAIWARHHVSQALWSAASCLSVRDRYRVTWTLPS